MRDARSTSSDQQLRELVKFLARRAAEEDHESWLQRQRTKKLKETKNPPKPH
jgi:ribosomal protein L18E